nr:hypothetical protein [Tanacetum cinerariifolium]
MTTGFLLPHPKRVAGGGVVSFARLQHGVRKLLLVGRIGEVLGFEAEAGVLAVDYAIFAFQRAIQEVTSVELHAG